MEITIISVKMIFHLQNVNPSMEIVKNTRHALSVRLIHYVDGVGRVIHVLKGILIVLLDISVIQLYIIIYMEEIVNAKSGEEILRY